MNKFMVATDVPYDIIVGRNLLKDTGEYIRKYIKPCKACIITDSTVNRLYSETVESSLLSSGFSVKKIIFPEGEHSKNLTTYGNILEALSEEGVSRSDIIVSLGGGIVGDLAGFVAATYLRGIKYVQIPTTYLAALDSSIGGKTGINLLYGKNLAGAFWQPSLVICDYKTFETLELHEILNGTAEAVKNAMLMEAGLFDKILSKSYEDVISRCVSIKKSIVEADERDTGMRQLLNFGHTAGHSIEKLSSYTISHGHAVAMGMVLESKGAYRMGLTDFDGSLYLTKILNEIGFDLNIPYSSDDIYKYALTDKKIKDGHIAMVIPEDVGKCKLHKISLDELKDFLKAGLE